MVRKILVLFLLVSLFSCGSDKDKQPPEGIQSIDSLQLIPYPQSVEEGEGYFELNRETNFYFPEEIGQQGQELVHSFIDVCTSEPKVNIKEDTEGNSVSLILDENLEITSKSPEAYQLTITDSEINIIARDPAGISRGMATLKQLMSAPIGESNSCYFPAVNIVDYPGFEHRGLLLDVCRHYFDKGVVMKYLDVMAYYKMNVLHLHLTEDQGWRMPIDKYPLLDEISSWRLDSNGNKYGGHYTKDELKEIVNYAAQKHITIIPEIELPGHSQAALAAYPQFSCNGGPIEVVNDWGVFKEIYCAGNDSTFTFLEDVLTEVMEIFPSEYIHIGGDEAPKFRWEHCPKCQKRMKDEGLADEHELQSYFIQRIERFLNENGRQLIGWDEILEGGLSENATVQSWRGMEGGKTAAEEMHKVIMSPTSHCYLDYSLSSIDLQKIYAFDPIPEDLEPEFSQYIIGGECNMWTERVPDEANLDSKVFPRMIGLAEVLWTYPEERDFENLYARLQKHYPTLKDFYHIDYGLETIGASVDVEFGDSLISIVLNKNLPDLLLKYKWTGRRNHGVFTPYESPVPLENGKLSVQAYKNGVPYGEEVTQRFTTHKALNKHVDYKTNYNEWYIGNADKNLVDGKLGSIDFRDGNWQGFWGENIDVIIDLGKVTELKHISAQFYQYANSWIFLPKAITIELSRDGEKWFESGTYKNPEVDLSNEKRVEFVGIELSPEPGQDGNPEARYIRFVVESIGKVPGGHEAAGQDSWLFIDEIMAYGF